MIPAFINAKFTSTLLICGTLAVSQGLIGCSRSDDKKTKKTDTAAQSDPKATALDCASPAAVGGIQQYLTKQIAQQATSSIQQLGQQAGINVANVSMDNLLAQLMVNVQNIKPVAGQTDQCQGKVSVTIPANDIANANQMAASLNQPTLAQRLSAKGLSLENNTIIADNATFKVVNTSGNYQVTSIGSDNLIAEISNVLASSQLKQMMIQNAPTLNSRANPANNPATSDNAVATGAAAAVGTAVATQHAKKHNEAKQHSDTHAATNHPKAAHKTNVKSDDDDDTDEDSPKKATTVKSTKTLTDSNSKTVTTKTTSTEKTPTKTTTTTTEKTTVKPQAVPNDATKLTIEQRNEKY